MFFSSINFLGTLPTKLSSGLPGILLKFPKIVRLIQHKMYENVKKLSKFEAKVLGNVSKKNLFRSFYQNLDLKNKTKSKYSIKNKTMTFPEMSKK
jgi:hypothetical protein